MRRHAVLLAVVVALGAALRIALASGYGLGDDHGYFRAYYRLYTSGAVDAEMAYDFRLAFAAPVVATMRLIGPTEVGFLAFVTLCSVANLVLVYLLARQDWEPETALVAASLLAVFPLDVLCSTLFVIDIALATWCFAAFWLFREALRAPASRTRLGLAAASGVALFLGYSTKQWAVLVAALFLLEALAALRRALLPSLVATAAFVVLAGANAAWLAARFGDPLYDLRLVRAVAAFLPHDRTLLLDYPRMLLLPNEYGGWFAGFYPHALVLLACIFAHRTGAAGKWLAYTAILLVLLAAAPSHRENGRWVILVPHIFRYLCLLSIPLCLALAAYVREVRRWQPAAAAALTAVLLGLGLWHAVTLTAPTRDAFGEERRALRALRAFPDDTMWLDVNLGPRFANLELWPARVGRLVLLRSEDPAARATELAAIEDGIVVTGGGRLPWYGCHRCTANLGGFTPPATWTLVEEWPGRTTGYRAEPLRIWRVSAAASRASALLAERGAPADAAAFVRELDESGDHRGAAAAGDQLLAAAPSPPPVALLEATGLALLRGERYQRAGEVLADRLARGGDGPAEIETIVLLALAAVGRTDFDAARGWLAEYHRRLPDTPLDPRLADVQSGIAEAIARYHQLRYRDAVRLCTDLLQRSDRGVRRRGRYFLALTLFRMTLLEPALAHTEEYRAANGEDDLWLELHYRHAEALRRVQPAAARAIFTDIMTRFPQSVWAGQAQREVAALPPA